MYPLHPQQLCPSKALPPGIRTKLNRPWGLLRPLPRYDISVRAQPSGSVIVTRASSAQMRGSRPSSWRAIYCNPGWLATSSCCPQSGVGTRSKLFSVGALLDSLCKACRHPLVPGSMIKRGAQPSAGMSLAGRNNSRCCSLIGCYGISERPFITLDNLCESFS